MVSQFSNVSSSKTIFAQKEKQVDGDQLKVFTSSYFTSFSLVSNEWHLLKCVKWISISINILNKAVYY